MKAIPTVDNNGLLPAVRTQAEPASGTGAKVAAVAPVSRTALHTPKPEQIVHATRGPAEKERPTTGGRPYGARGDFARQEIPVDFFDLFGPQAGDAQQGASRGRHAEASLRYRAAGGAPEFFPDVPVFLKISV